MSVKPNREYRDFYSAEFEPLEESGLFVRGYATTFNDPYVLWEEDGIQYKEMIAPDALQDADFSDVIFLYNHQGMVYARNNKTETLKLVPDEKGLLVEADLRLLADFGGGELYAAIKTGLVNKMSWAFTVKSDHYDAPNHTRIIDRIAKVYDVSAVSIPADPNTDITARAFFDGAIEVEKAERLAQGRARLLLRIKSF